MEKDLLRIDGIKWWITKSTTGTRLPVPLCPQHNMRLKPKIKSEYDSRYRKTLALRLSESDELICKDDSKVFKIPRKFDEEKEYVIDKVDAKVFSGMKVINLDDEVTPVAKEQLKGTDYWVKAKVTESKSGTRLIVWAGNKSKKNKTQLFVEPELKRLSFDQNDDHPTQVFSKVEAVFADKIKAKIEK